VGPRRAQVLVELALAMPLILLLLLGAIESGFLLVAKAHQDRSTAVVAAYAASHSDESWHSVAEHELSGCDVTLTSPRPDLLEVSATCQYHPVVLVIWSGLPMTSRESSTSGPSPSDSPAPSPAGSSS
jgi:hypothetical protein